ncbi:MAG: HEAT repeat domain-containing protein [Planctomycetota bacterium]|nr:HEAT repeat domain-containing protein [Planctomycetota bacterium]
MPSANPEPESRTEGAAASRNALLVLGVGQAFFALGLYGTLAEGFTSIESYALVGLAGSVSLVLALWTFILGVRALTADSPRRWPMLLVALALLEWALPCAWAWKPLWAREEFSEVQTWFYGTGLPVFAPFFCLAALAGMPAAWLLWRGLERRRLRRNLPASSAAQRRRSLWLCFGAVMLAAVVGVLPFPLYLYAIVSNYSTLYSKLGKRRTAEQNWRDAVVARAPDYVRVAVEWGLRGLENDAPDWRLLVLHRGQLPASVLRDYLLHDEYCGYAWFDWQAGAQDELNELAERLALRDPALPVRLKPGDRLFNVAGFQLGKSGSLEDFKRCLTDDTDTEFLDGLNKSLKEYARAEFAPLLAARAEGPAPASLWYLHGATLLSSPEACETLWRTMLAANNPEVARRAATILSEIPDDKVFGKLALEFLEARDPQVRRNTVFDLLFINKRRVEGAAAIKVLLRRLADPDQYVRRGAVKLIREVLDPPVDAVNPFQPAPPAAYPPMPFDKVAASSWEIPTSLCFRAPRLDEALTPEAAWEKACIEDVRADAEDWLKAHDVGSDTRP